MDTPVRKTSSSGLFLIFAIVMTALFVLNIYRSMGATKDVSPLMVVLSGAGAVAAWAIYLRKKREARS